MPPQVLAHLAKRFPKPSGGLLHNVIRHMDHKYRCAFLEGFSETEVYELAFGQSLDRIRFAPSDDSYIRFLNRDFADKVAEASLQQIQLFLRNVGQYGFGKHHRQRTGRAFAAETLQANILKKVKEGEASLSDLAFFLLNLSVLDVEAGETYILSRDEPGLGPEDRRGELGRSCPFCPRHLDG